LHEYGSAQLKKLFSYPYLNTTLSNYYE